MSNSSYQLAMALLVLFIAYVAHMVHAPYMTYAKAADVVAEHSRKALISKIHARVRDQLLLSTPRREDGESPLDVGLALMPTVLGGSGDADFPPKAAKAKSKLPSRARP